MKNIKKVLTANVLETHVGPLDLKKTNFKYLVIFFYPKDDTSACTLENQQFTELLSAFKKKKALVLGVSRDSMKSHQKFVDKYSLEVPLIADVEEEICSAFDVIKEKNMYGRKVLGIERSTFVLDAEIKVLKEWRKLKADGHAEEVLEFIASM